MKDQLQVPKFERAESPTRRLLDQTRLSRLPPVPPRVVCENCDGRIEDGNEFQAAVKLCRKCLTTYANIAAIIERHTDAKIRRNFKGANNK